MHIQRNTKGRLLETTVENGLGCTVLNLMICTGRNSVCSTSTYIVLPTPIPVVHVHTCITWDVVSYISAEKSSSEADNEVKIL